MLTKVERRAIDRERVRVRRAQAALADIKEATPVMLLNPDGPLLRDADRHGLRCVRVIHGKGLGSVNKEPVLKNKVRNWLVQKDEVIAFCQARAADGGSGALMVLLKARS